jgi:hypothetical protein
MLFGVCSIPISLLFTNGTEFAVTGFDTYRTCFIDASLGNDGLYFVNKIT